MERPLCTYACMEGCVHTYMHVHSYVCVHYMYVYMHVHVCVCVYLFLHPERERERARACMYVSQSHLPLSNLFTLNRYEHRDALHHQ